MDEFDLHVRDSPRQSIKWERPRKCRVGKTEFLVVGEWCQHAMPALMGGKQTYLPRILICVNPYGKEGFVEISPQHPYLRWLD